jgi:hypothetical protein
MNLTFYDQKGNQVEQSVAIYWKSGSIFGILSPDVFPLIEFEKTFPLKRGVVFQDFYVPFLDWQKIRTSDLWIAGWNHPLILGHLSLWNQEPPLNAKKTLAGDRAAYENLKNQLNAEFFLHIAALLDRAGQDYLKSLPLESTEKYTLEGFLRTVHQEMTSSLLKERQEKIKALKLALFSDSRRREDPFLHEKELVRERAVLEANLDAILEAADQLKNEFQDFSAFQTLVRSNNWEERESALGRLAKMFSLQLILIGNPQEKEVQSALEILQRIE